MTDDEIKNIEVIDPIFIRAEKNEMEKVLFLAVAISTVISVGMFFLWSIYNILFMLYLILK